jgi:hypothetical protein
MTLPAHPRRRWFRFSLRTLFLVLTVLGACFWCGMKWLEYRDSISLADAVEIFNAGAKSDRIGKDQPALTENEVVAAIRGWDRKIRPPASDAVYNAFQKIADKGRIPKNAKLRWTTAASDGLHRSDVWRIDLDLVTGEKSGYTFRVRDRTISVRPNNPSSNGAVHSSD